MSLLFAASSVFAQKAVTVQGVVTDATFNEPVIGANVLVKGTTVGTICDMDGKYLIENVPADGTLVFSFIGMRTVEVKVNGNTTVNVVLSDDVQQLEDVVVIGYGTSKAKDLTAPISVVNCFYRIVITDVGFTGKSTWGKYCFVWCAWKQP